MKLSILLEQHDEISLSALKLIKLKKSIIRRLALKGEATISELGKETDFSVPTVTRMVGELIEQGIVFEKGKAEGMGGRKPVQYAINPHAGYYLGVEVKRDSILMGIQDFKNEFIRVSDNIAYTLENTRESLVRLCNIINRFVADSGVELSRFIGACVNLSGRINSEGGFSYSYFFFEETPLSQIIENQIKIKTFLENDTRAMAYGEYNCGVVHDEKNVIFVNMSWGVGIGIICDGKLYYGKSGYSGEFGHSPVFDNEVICQCGKKGCLETEVSGQALVRHFMLALENGSNSILNAKAETGKITMDDILTAITKNEDSTAIEIIENIGGKLGRYLSMLINIFNPELVVLGGDLSETGMYLSLPVRTAVHKFSLNLVSADMKLKQSTLGDKAGIIGSCYILRDKLFYTV